MVWRAASRGVGRCRGGGDLLDGVWQGWGLVLWLNEAELKRFLTQSLFPLCVKFFAKEKCEQCAVVCNIVIPHPVFLFVVGFGIIRCQVGAEGGRVEVGKGAWVNDCYERTCLEFVWVIKKFSPLNFVGQHIFGNFGPLSESIKPPKQNY